ncbi:TPA: hypothetical protein JBB06_09105 [Legionella pneumophila subsp. pneumophila]|uniref:hypothetical protein n=1 Tax=Legionella pneumophila TaxID=446 RepID=UPI00059B0B42|nr:hypothetical protein [Legionella pneumophila]HAT2039631.1 hypothetical protein [Legionella pneumophila]HAT8939668.1 hypothetical protein [Legionella pneumophila subsp. pneumophila]HAT9031680.1 hypothetical protein [Legionella pneumophila subsp. pneumophila]HAU0125718.1 hypothetical protein [Legionella pneumophila]HAU0262304.1 hypothetical protein [Legionella pneumophila]
MIKNRIEKGQTEENKEKLQKKLENPPEHYEKHEDIENLLMPKKNKPGRNLQVVVLDQVETNSNEFSTAFPHTHQAKYIP